MNNKYSIEKSSFASKRTSERKQPIIPSMNVDEKPDRYIVTIALPGMKRDDISVKVKGDCINVRTLSRTKGENVIETCSRHNHQEYDYSHGHRNIKLPENADVIMIQAYYEYGELRIIVPKLPATELQASTKPINIAIY